MKQIIVLMLCSFLVITSCQKEIDGSVDRPAGTDSTRKWTIVEVTSENVVSYVKFDMNGLLVETGALNAEPFEHYYRDGKGRVTTHIIGQGSNLDSTITFVYYQDGNSGAISYTVSHESNMPNKILDSNVYIYEGGKLVKTMFYIFQTGTAFLAYYYAWSYDTKNNISLMRLFNRDSSGNYVPNIGYEFLYDDKINPFYTSDQVRQHVGWSISSSPNNVVKQINHYPPNYPFPDDYITYTYTYDLYGRPITWEKSGPFIKTMYATYKYK